MWQRCKRPRVDEIQFSVATDLKLFKNSIYAAYVPQTTVVVVGGTECRALRRPRGSEEKEDTLDWTALKCYLKKQHIPLDNWEWWVAENPWRLPRYRRRRIEGYLCENYGISVKSYQEQPELVRKFWRNTTARLFNFVDTLALSEEECTRISPYAQQWAPKGWFPIYYETNRNYDEWFPPTHLFKRLRSLAEQQTLPIAPNNLAEANTLVKVLLARLSKRFCFLDIPINGLLSFVLIDRIVENLWNESETIVIERSHVFAAIRNWFDHVGQIGFHIENRPLERSVHFPNILHKLKLPIVTMGTIDVLDNDVVFLKRGEWIDFNYVEAPEGLILAPRWYWVPVLPVLHKSERTGAFLYSILQSEHVQCFTERAYLLSSIQLDNKRYVLSMLANATAEKIINFLQ